MCSLTICKPGIRRVADRGDWVAGLGSKNSPSGDLSGCLVYAMRAEEVLSLRDYDFKAASRWPERIPNIYSADLSDRLGDWIYDYSRGKPCQRPSVHGTQNIETDLSGENALLSWDFYYFGSSVMKLPDTLLPICHQTQGHRSDSNAPYCDRFVSWLRGLARRPGMYGWPDFSIDWLKISSAGGCLQRKWTMRTTIPAEHFELRTNARLHYVYVWNFPAKTSVSFPNRSALTDGDAVRPIWHKGLTR